MREIKQGVQTINQQRHEWLKTTNGTVDKLPRTYCSLAGKGTRYFHAGNLSKSKKFKNNVRCGQINEFSRKHEIASKHDLRGRGTRDHISDVAITVKDGPQGEKDWLETAMATIPSDANGSNANSRRGSYTHMNSIEKPKNIAIYANKVSAKDDLQGEKDWLEAAMTTIHF
ncbi:hypothetical protein [Sporomusa acidovorans]|uniref:Uncharacterized protein n=1 Tax=Sporomusa acidovorans (strain ATCC 49682 / DSM 3132 / Mol) TaxID=1123286 RepID=A0ABZ3J1U6_SPOA4|nr:hypothetical protein [Sporomusa acidovorans]OZC14668.1 hypothetical protein SPACI_52290 [Sporomusa acidovorans DSM 3132]SDF85821.1 hypothetical protein SAMN04488499_11042 [Sporomusa acidovorans]